MLHYSMRSILKQLQYFYEPRSKRAFYLVYVTQVKRFMEYDCKSREGCYLSETFYGIGYIHGKFQSRWYFLEVRNRIYSWGSMNSMASSCECSDWIAYGKQVHEVMMQFA